ncbi:PP2C family protein-serine/threonine phosphatase [Sandaracinus amylolyticus]|nr:PP2C family serine/threonine-protein phosphatase [Sandaracinus amylolyticus]
MRRVSSGLTDVGRRRVSNEDAFGLDDELGLYVVADGMGGHAAGEIASREAVDNVMAMVRRQRDVLTAVQQGDRSPETMRRVLRVMESAIQAATYMVFAIAENEPEQRGMGTTLSSLLVIGDVGITGQVGDSRVYQVRHGQVTRLTEDHTLVAWQVKQGIISAAEAERSPHKNVITRAVGSRDYVQVDTHVVDIQPGDSFLLCSDGLHGYLEDHEIPAIVDLGPAVATRHFIELANKRGGRDNITALVIEIL